MIDVSMSARIAAPPEKVWEVLADYPNVYQWVPYIKHSRATTAHTSGIGAGRACQIPGFGETDERVIEWDEGRSFRYEIQSSGGPIKRASNRWTVRKEAGGSLVQVDFEGEMRYGPLGALMARIMVGPMMKRMIGQALDGLRRRVLTGEHVHG